VRRGNTRRIKDKRERERIIKERRYLEDRGQENEERRMKGRGGNTV